MKVYELLIGRKIKLKGKVYTILERKEWFSQGYSAGYIYKLEDEKGDWITIDIDVLETAELY